MEKYWLEVVERVKSDDCCESFEVVWVREYDEKLVRELREWLKSKGFEMVRKKSVEVVECWM